MKKIIATLLTATLVVANCVPAFAATADGTGSVEYNNSVDVTYDSIQLPTLTDATYNFTLDPTDMLYTFDKTTYARGAGEENPGVYFHSQKTGAKIAEKLDQSSQVVEELYTLSKTAVAADAADWQAVVTAVTEDTNKTPTVAEGYYVWTPAAFTAQDVVENTTPTGKKGVFTALDASNIKNYFEISEKDAQNKYTITVKVDHLAGNSVCDGKLYKDTYTDLAGLTDNKPTVDLSEYVTLAADGKSITAVKNVYKSDGNGGYVLADAADIAFTPAEVVYQDTTDKVVVTNKSTNKKTVKAVVTMSNISGLTFAESDDFTGDATASVYFNATDGTKDAVLEQGETTATATYTIDVNGANVSANQILYQGEPAGTVLGGHNYYNYEAFGTAYNSNSFYIEAKANTEDDAAEAWKTYGKNATAAPSINIVYTVTDFQAAPTTYTVTYKANYTADPAVADQTETVNVGSNPTANGISFTREGYTFKGWGTSATATEADKVTLSSISSATDLYAIWEEIVPEEPVTGEGLTAVSGQAYDYTATFTKGTAYDINFTGVTSATWAATVDGTYATSANITVGTDKVTIAAGNWAAASVGNDRFVKVSDGTNDYIIKFTIGGTVTGSGMSASSESGIDYTATFTKGTAYDINFTGVTSATWAATVDGTYAASANITVGTDKVTIAAGNWAGANAGDFRFVKVSDGTYTYTIKFTIATN